MRMTIARVRWGFLAALVFWGFTSARASHLRAGEITVTRQNCTSLTFTICITVYTNTGSTIRFGDGNLDFGDGSPIFRTPSVENTLRPDLPPNVGMVRYCTTHTYSGPGEYIISYLEPNRNGGILNMFDSFNTTFFLQTQISIDPFLGCNNSPQLLVPPIDKACTGAAWFHNPGAYDPDGDSLSFELVVPLKDRAAPVTRYAPPNSPDFYKGLNYDRANEEGTARPTFSINQRTGTITWDAPGSAGEYNIAFIIREWRKIGGEWVRLGYVTRDMQIIVEDCRNERPRLKIPPDICVEAGTLIDQRILGFDPDGDSVKIEAFSQVFILPSPARFTPDPPRFQTSNPSRDAVGTFRWQTTCDHVKDQPYQIVFKITDNPRTGPRLVEFKTWNVRVVGPAPKWKSAQLNLATRSANLEWNRYFCANNAQRIEVYRRVDSFPFTPPECVTGIPDFLGYSKIGETSATATTFVDTNLRRGLAPGAQYCYRLVAFFPQPRGGESYVSAEICVPPIEADAPVITNVSVDRTNTQTTTTGQITVKWRSPFDVNRTQFPPPYRYEVWRAEGFTGTNRLTRVSTGRQLDSSFVDAGPNARETIYNYRIIAFDNNDTRLDTAFEASSVRLELAPALKKIQLTWQANVPWSNNTNTHPWHLIYRGTPNQTENQFVLIDSVNVNNGRFLYVDSGQYNRQPLRETDFYCYRVMTRGAYGNPKIREPLVNFSQVACAQPNDNEKPCQPKFAASLEGVKCDAFILQTPCDAALFSNTLKWNRPTDAACREDVKSYKIYVAGKVGDEFTELISVKDTFYIDRNLPSFARCYKIAAIDRSGNESELSEAFCFDNCPTYELPNVFTPNGDGCNDLFSAFSERDVRDENGNFQCGEPAGDLRGRCARFVQRVQFTVFNRWGGEVYSYTSGGERNIYIDWNGQDNNNRDLPTGVYYYSAEVTFDVVDPARQTRTQRGWVHLIR